MIFVKLSDDEKLYVKQGLSVVHDTYIDSILKGSFYDFILKDKKCLERIQQTEES